MPSLETSYTPTEVQPSLKEQLKTKFNNLLRKARNTLSKGTPETTATPEAAVEFTELEGKFINELEKSTTLEDISILLDTHYPFVQDTSKFLNEKLSHRNFGENDDRDGASPKEFYLKIGNILISKIDVDKPEKLSRNERFSRQAILKIMLSSIAPAEWQESAAKLAKDESLTVRVPNQDHLDKPYYDRLVNSALQGNTESLNELNAIERDKKSRHQQRTPNS